METKYIFTNKKTNIHNFIKKYKNKTFILNNNLIEFEVKLSKTKSSINSKLDYYSLNTIENSSIFGIKYIFEIYFFYEKPSFENVYIANISKSKKYSGSDVVNFVIDFLQSFKQVKKIYLDDGAEVSCKNTDNIIDLSLYKLITSYGGFYQKFGFRLVMKNDEKNITNIIVSLAKKVSNYKVKDILENFKEIIELVEKYKQNVQVLEIIDWLKILEETTQKNLKKFMYDIGYLYFAMMPYKKYTFGKFIEKINNEKCFMLSQLFDSLKKIIYVEFRHDKKKIISHFLLDYHNLIIYRHQFYWKGIYMKKIK
jgi:hypothetical protein